MLFRHYNKPERINFRCSFPEHPNIIKTQYVWERMARTLKCDGICIHPIPGLEKPTPELGKKWWEQGGTENNKVSQTKCFAEFSAAFYCHFQMCLSFFTTVKSLDSWMTTANFS